MERQIDTPWVAPDPIYYPGSGIPYYGVFRGDHDHVKPISAHPSFEEAAKVAARLFWPKAYDTWTGEPYE